MAIPTSSTVNPNATAMFDDDNNTILFTADMARANVDGYNEHIQKRKTKEAADWVCNVALPKIKERSNYGYYSADVVYRYGGQHAMIHGDTVNIAMEMLAKAGYIVENHTNGFHDHALYITWPKKPDEDAEVNSDG